MGDPQRHQRPSGHRNTNLRKWQTSRYQDRMRVVVQPWTFATEGLHGVGGTHMEDDPPQDLSIPSRRVSATWSSP